MKHFINITMLLIISCIFAAGNYLINSNKPDLSLAYDEVTLAMLNCLPLDFIIIDARSSAEFNNGHIESAINLSEQDFDNQLIDLLDVWTPKSTILVYCSTGGCNSSRNISNRLKTECSMQNIYILKDDWTKWKR